MKNSLTKQLQINNKNYQKPNIKTLKNSGFISAKTL